MKTLSSISLGLACTILLVCYSPKVGNLDYKYNLMDRLAPTPERYNRARELYHKDKFTHAQVLIAKYRNPQNK